MNTSPLSAATSPDMDERAKFWGNVGKWGIGIFGCAILAPVFWLALGGLLGFLAFSATAYGSWKLRPWFYMKMANLRIKLIRGEAARNPVETLLEEHRNQSVILDERKKGLDELAGAIRTVDQAIDALAPDDPELVDLRAQQGELEGHLEGCKKDWQEAYVSLGLFRKEIDRVQKLWEVSLALAKARRQSGLTEQEWLSKMKTQTSLDAIRTNLNKQLTGLSNDRMQAEADRILKGKTTTKSLVAVQPSVTPSTTPARQDIG